MKTIADLRSYVRSQAQRDWRDYGYGAEAQRLWRQDGNEMRRQRDRVMRRYPSRIRSEEPLVPGNYGRLTIQEDGTPYYVPGQYAPTEIWFWVLEYLNRTN
jgi:hypothetical protein|tara:strand:- start:32 stop:334 length:303 start_codon:yes stop_codon:yes gene_type:complete